MVHTLGGTRAGASYPGLAVNTHGHIFINRLEEERGCIEEYDTGGEHLRGVRVPGLERGKLAVDAGDRLYIPCKQSGDVKVLSPDGVIIRRIDLSGKIVPQAVAVGSDGRMWVCGQIP